MNIKIGKSTLIINSIIGNNQSISINNNRVTINGQTYDLPKGNVSIINNKIFVNGKEFDTNNSDLKNATVVNIIVEGNVNELQCDGSVEVKGDVFKGIDCGGSVRIIGNVEGDIDCGGSVKIEGEHKGSIDAGGSVSIR